MVETMVLGHQTDLQNRHSPDFVKNALHIHMQKALNVIK